MKIHESAEDYLEAILMLQEKNGYCRSIDVAQELGFSKASISIAMKKLRENGYISIEEKGNITLLEPGLEIATRIFERHKLFINFFETLGIDEKTAKEDACRIEHDLSPVTYKKVKEQIEIFLKKQQ